MRCTEVFEILETAARSRIVRFVRSATQTTSTRYESGRAHGRPRRRPGMARRCTTNASRRSLIAARTRKHGIVIVRTVA
jgi:hypothetical protein